MDAHCYPRRRPARAAVLATTAVLAALVLSSGVAGGQTARKPPPTASFVFAPAEPTVDQTVEFDASGSSDDRAVTRYEWDFDDNGTFEVDRGSDPRASQVFTQSGNRRVHLRVTDSTDETSQTTRTVPVRARPTQPPPEPPARAPEAAPPVASFSTPAGVRPGALSEFDGSASTGAAPLRYRWTFGGKPVDAGTAPTVRHGFLLPGDFRVRLTVIDSSGRESSTERSVHVAEQPEAALTVSPAFPEPGDTVRFELATATDAQARPQLYLWDFDDGKEADDAAGGLRFPGLHPTLGGRATHVFKKPGLHTVVARVVTGDGQAVVISHRLRVGRLPGRAAPRKARASASTPTVSGALKAYEAGGVDGPVPIAAIPNVQTIGLPHTGAPTTVLLSTTEHCHEADFKNRKTTLGPLGDLKAKISGTNVVYPADQLEQAEQEGYEPGAQFTGKAVSFQARRARAAQKTCLKVGYFRVLSVDWGDGKKVGPQGGFGQLAKVPHAYTSPGKRTVKIRVAITLDLPGPKTKVIGTTTLVHQLAVGEANCGPLYLRGARADVSGGASSCWVQTPLGWAPATGEFTVGGMVVRSSSPVGFPTVQANRPGEPEGPGNGAVLAGPVGKLKLIVAGKELAETASFTVPPGNPHVLADVITTGAPISGLAVQGGDILLGDDGQARTVLRLRLPEKFDVAPGQPATVTTDPIPPGQVGDPNANVPAKGPPSLPFGSISLPGLSLTHDADGWHGGAEFELGTGLPSISAPDVLGASGIGILNNGQAYLGAELDFGATPPSFLSVLSLQKIGIFGSIKPTSLTGTVQIGLINANIFTLNGGLGIVWPEGSGNTVKKFCVEGNEFEDTLVNGQPKPWTMRLCGKPVLFDLLELASGFIQVDGSGLVQFGGTVDYNLPSDETKWLSANATLDGSYASPKNWQANAHGKLCEHLVDDTCVTGDLWVTPKGAAGCIDLWVSEVGAYVTWDPVTFDYFLRSCGARAPKKIGAARAIVDPPAFAAQLGGPSAVTVEGDEHHHLIKVVGQDAPPIVEVTSPDGKRKLVDDGKQRKQCLTLAGKHAPCGGSTPKNNGILRSEKTNTTLVVIRGPQAGKWTVTTRAGSSLIKEIDHTVGLGDPQLQGKVEGLKAGGRLSLDLKGLTQPGMAVSLFEEGAGKSAPLRTAGARASSVLPPVARPARTARRLRFTPRPYLGRKRRVVAHISVDGIPWKSVTIARFTAPPEPRPSAPKRVTARLVRGGLLVSWTPGRGAARYQVGVTTPTGRTAFAEVSGKRTSYLVRGYRATDGAEVSLRTVTKLLVRLPKIVRTRVRPAAAAPVVASFRG